jgi:hypothetical protein
VTMARSLILAKLFLLLAFSPASALASPIKIMLPAVCPSHLQMEEFILMCGQNKYVAAQALHCANALSVSWQTAANQLLPALKSRGKQGNQSELEADALASYWDAVNAVDDQIRQMQQYTAIIEMYPKIMIDAPASTGDKTSLSCFNEAFHQVQEIVTHLDKEIVRAKSVKKSAMSLAGVASSRQQSLATSIGPGSVRNVETASSPRGTSPRSASTITGEIKNEMLDSKLAGQKISQQLSKSPKRPPFAVEANSSNSVNSKNRKTTLQPSFSNEEYIGSNSNIGAETKKHHAYNNQSNEKAGNEISKDNLKPNIAISKLGENSDKPLLANSIRGLADETSRTHSSNAESLATSKKVDIESCEGFVKTDSSGNKSAELSIILRNSSKEVLGANKPLASLGHCVNGFHSQISLPTDLHGGQKQTAHSSVRFSAKSQIPVFFVSTIESVSSICRSKPPTQSRSFRRCRVREH